MHGLAVENFISISLYDFHQMGGDNCGGVDNGVSFKFRFLFLLLIQPICRHFVGRVNGFNTFQSLIFAIRCQGQIVSGHHFAGCDLVAFNFNDIFAGFQLHVVPDANRRNDDTELLSNLLANHSYAVEQIAALVYIDHWDKTVTDFNFKRINVKIAFDNLLFRRFGQQLFFNAFFL